MFFRCCPKTYVNFRKKITGNTFEDDRESRKVSFIVSQTPYTESLEPISCFTWSNVQKHSHWELHLKTLPNFFLNIVRDTNYLTKTYQKINICERVKNYYQIQCQLYIHGSQIYTFPRNVCFLKELPTSRYLFIIIKMPFFVKFSFQN